MSDTDAKELASHAPPDWLDDVNAPPDWLDDVNELAARLGMSSAPWRSYLDEAAAALLLRQAAQIAKLETQIAKAIQELRPSSGIASIGAACAALEKP